MRKRRKPEKCYFCVENVNEIDYKDVALISRFMSSFAKIVARKRSGVCMAHQRKLSLAIKRARLMALVPFIRR